MMKKTLCLLAFIVAFASCRMAHLRSGDLLFHVTEADNAITAVTPGMIDHVAIVVSKDSVIEAVGQGVVVNAVNSLKGRHLIARVRHANRKKSVKNARTYLGLPYDTLFLPDNRAVYCSELVQLAFVDRRNRPIFQTVPMTFRDSTGQIPAYWQELYRRHGIAVPEGHPGSNPAELSQRKSIKIIGERFIALTSCIIP